MYLLIKVSLYSKINTISTRTCDYLVLFHCWWLRQKDSSFHLQGPSSPFTHYLYIVSFYHLSLINTPAGRKNCPCNQSESVGQDRRWKYQVLLWDLHIRSPLYTCKQVIQMHLLGWHTINKIKTPERVTLHKLPCQLPRVQRERTERKITCSGCWGDTTNRCQTLGLF